MLINIIRHLRTYATKFESNHTFFFQKNAYEKYVCELVAILSGSHCTVYPKKYAHGFCFAVLCCGYTLTDFPISIRLTSLALWQSNDCPSASKATLMHMDKYVMWIHYERLHNHNKAKHNKTVCIFLGIYCIYIIRRSVAIPYLRYSACIYYLAIPMPPMLLSYPWLTFLYWHPCERPCRWRFIRKWHWTCYWACLVRVRLFTLSHFYAYKLLVACSLYEGERET